MRQLTIGGATLASLLWVIANPVAAGETAVEVRVDGQTFRGLIEAHDDHTAYMIGADGEMRSFPIEAVSTFRPTGQRLSPKPIVAVRADLQREFGGEYEVVTSSRYVVVAPRGRARAYLATFDEIGRTFIGYFRRRRIPLSRPEFPLVAIIFATPQEFADYAQRDGVGSVESVAGYYLRTSNRVAAYESTSGRGRALAGLGQADFRVPPAGEAAVDDRLIRTLIHEATHQMAFNSGLHHRAGVNPKWVVEGLATLLEPDGVREGRDFENVESRVNAGRLRYAQRVGLESWTTGSLVELVSSDAPFKRDAGSAYSLAWCLSFYLNETRASDYARYLATLKARDPLAPYPPTERLRDFRLVFGHDMARFDAGLRRFLEQLPEA